MIPLKAGQAVHNRRLIVKREVGLNPQGEAWVGMASEGLKRLDRYARLGQGTTARGMPGLGKPWDVMHDVKPNPTAATHRWMLARGATTSRCGRGLFQMDRDFPGSVRAARRTEFEPLMR
jgi:hypothetical protein